MKKILTVPMGFLLASVMLPTEVVHGTDGTLPFAVQAPLQTVAPVLDGAIGVGEYDFMLPVSFADAMNPGEVSTLVSSSWLDDPSDTNLSVNLYLGHDATNIYFGFEVTDNFIESANNAAQPWRNDGIELVINGDGVNNDLGTSAEGFRYIVDAAGNSFDVGSSGLTNATTTTATGYNVEIVVPLASIDTIDGTGVANPATGDSLKFTFAVTDNDVEDFDGQETFLLLWNLNDFFPSVNETAAAVDLELTALAEPNGDFDGDLDVDGFDFLQWQRGNSPNNGSTGDLADWESNYGTGAGPLSGIAAVPEPSTALLAGILGLLLVGPSRRNGGLRREVQKVASQKK